ncbi:T9SS type A sorting domain-containing protein [uncultured Psychroserpens sp.]|uniref:zinc-dependent metalloprotease n=1 Tax=uncultured Psychroserpens sp. TaxID=255436 RepID=UPI002624B9F1|nr:T9SS type A sorting domain-containing protein [uncultured Psychroserpens sp.]
MEKNFTFKSIIAAFLLLFAITGYSQERTCGMVEYMEEQMQDPEFARAHEERQAEFKARLQQSLAGEDFSQRGTGPIIIPVAVHFPTANEGDRDCLEALAQNQIDILNADYTATNADIAQWNTDSPLYPGTTAGVANIQFCLAVSNHPIGIDPELVEGNPCITIGYNFGNGNNIDANWSGYMNFVIRNIGALGFSPLGGSIAAGQAVTLDDNAFGSGAGCAGSGVVPQAPYNLGRTTTHELGHFYNLAHTFNADGGGTCGGGGGDGIADTPEVANSTYGCPTPGSIPSCVAGQSALPQNYMDYVNDACMYMFSAGQTNVMDTWVAGLEPSFKPNVCSPASPGFTIAANNSPIFTCPTTDDEAVFDLDFTTIAGFSENTTFSASGEPAGSTVAFNPTALNSNGSFTMTIGNLMATAEGEYTITVTGTSNSVTETVDVLLKNTCTSIQCSPNASPQNLALAIPDGLGTTGPVNGPPVTDIINVSDTTPIESMTVTVNLSHTWISDLLIRVVHPDGTTFANLWAGDCGDNDNISVTFDDNGGAIVCASPTTGTYAPTDALSIFNGMDPSGDWTILIADFFAGDTGTLDDWSIDICSEQPLSVSEFDADNFAIFPNPNNGAFTIKLNSNSGNDISVDVFDIRGRRIFENRYANTGDFTETVQLNNVQSGMYLVTVNDGNREVTKRIIVD